jgi:hypothetical protein
VAISCEHRKETLDVMENSRVSAEFVVTREVT